MQISEIRIKLVENRSDRLKAFCSMTIDNDFVIRDLKIIEGANGYFVAMPSRKITDRCPACGTKNHLRAKFCNECGKHLRADRSKTGPGRPKLHADIAHPINSSCRDNLQNQIIDSYYEEVEKSKQPGYIPPKMDDLDEDYFSNHHHNHHHDRDESKVIKPSSEEHPSVSYDQNTPKPAAQKNPGFSEGIC